MNTKRRSRPLYRDPKDKMIGGVCSGLGHYFDIDTVLVRIGFVVLTLVGGGGVVAYALLWAIVDPAPPGYLEEPTEPPMLTTEEGQRPSIDDHVDQSHDPTRASESARNDES